MHPTTPCDFLIADAPLPISLNAKDTVVILPDRRKKGGTRGSIGKSKKYKEYFRYTFTPWWQSVRAKGRMVFGEEVLFWTVTCPARAGCDTDNYHKVMLDCLEQAGAFRNDNVVVSTHNERGPRISGGLLRVFMADESRREALSEVYFEEYQRRWAPARSGPILQRPASLEIHRVAPTAHFQQA